MLAIDTVARACSAAIINDNKVYSIISDINEKNTDVILAMILELATQSDIEPANLASIIVTNGPGAFTGVRTGLLIAQMLALVSKSQILVASSSMALVAATDLKDGKYSVILDARMNEYYYSQYLVKNSVISELAADLVVQQVPESAYESDFLISNMELERFTQVQTNAESLFKIHKTLPKVAVQDLKPVYLRAAVSS